LIQLKLTGYNYFIKVNEARAAENEKDEDQEYEEPYFSEEEEEDSSSLVDLPAGLQGALQNEKLRRFKRGNR